MSEDLISRDAVLDACSQSYDILDAMGRIEELPSVNPKPCEDAISRQAAISTIREMEEWHTGDAFNADRVLKHLRDLPTVTPQPKTGHWIQTNEFFINQDGQFIYKFICSECKSLSYFRKSNKKAIGANVCPNCRCRMVEPQESEG